MGEPRLRLISLLALETRTLGACDLIMTENPSPAVAPAGWLESLERSKAQIAAGERVPLLPILDRLRASAERLEAEQGITEDGVKG